MSNLSYNSMSQPARLNGHISGQSQQRLQQHHNQHHQQHQHYLHYPQHSQPNPQIRQQQQQQQQQPRPQFQAHAQAQAFSQSSSSASPSPSPAALMNEQCRDSRYNVSSQSSPSVPIVTPSSQTQAFAIGFGIAPKDPRISAPYFQKYIDTTIKPSLTSTTNAASPITTTSSGFVRNTANAASVATAINNNNNSSPYYTNAAQLKNNSCDSNGASHRPNTTNSQSLSSRSFTMPNMQPQQQHQSTSNPPPTTRNNNSNNNNNINNNNNNNTSNINRTGSQQRHSTSSVANIRSQVRCTNIQHHIPGTDKYFSGPYIPTSELFNIIGDARIITQADNSRAEPAYRNEPQGVDNSDDDDKVEIVGIVSSPSTRTTNQSRNNTNSSQVKQSTKPTTNDNQGVLSNKDTERSVTVGAQNNEDSARSHFLKRKSTPRKAQIEPMVQSAQKPTVENDVNQPSDVVKKPDPEAESKVPPKNNPEADTPKMTEPGSQVVSAPPRKVSNTDETTESKDHQPNHQATIIEKLETPKTKHKPSEPITNPAKKPSNSDANDNSKPKVAQANKTPTPTQVSQPALAPATETGPKSAKLILKMQSEVSKEQTRSKNLKTPPSSIKIIQDTSAKEFGSLANDSTVRLNPPLPSDLEAKQGNQEAKLSQKPILPVKNIVASKRETKTPYSKALLNSVSIREVQSPFSWDIYLNFAHAEAAPVEAFMQSREPMENKFEIEMKLEARDPRNDAIWCLATVISKEGYRIGLRLDGTDDKNDFYELIDSENIRAIRSDQYDPLLPPYGFRGEIQSYSHFIEKTLMKAGTVLAPAECFYPPPKKPVSNLFKVGMKLEAIDKKNPLLICPSTIVEKTGDTVRVIFDGWSDSYGFTCGFDSRNLFPIKWCQNTAHRLSPPQGWDKFLRDKKPLVDIESILRATSLREQQPTPKKRGRPKTRSPTALNQSTSVKKRKIEMKSIRPNKPQYARKNASIYPPGRRVNQIGIENAVSVATETSTTTRDRVQNTPPPDDVIFQCQRTMPVSEWKTRSRGMQVLDGGSVVNDASRDKPVESSQHLEDKNSEPVNEAISQASGLAASVSQSPSVRIVHMESANVVGSSAIDSASSINSPSNASEKPNFINVSDWTVSDVLNYISTDEALAKYSDAFEENEIDGKAFLLLKPEFMINFMKIKVGPALKIQKLIESATKDM